MDRRTGRVVELLPTHLVGSSPVATLLIGEARVSAAHALIRWLGDGWHVKDLSSSNGTFLDGRRLEAGRWTPLWERVRLAFGDVEAEWSLVSGAPPPPLALLHRAPRVVAGEGGLIALPDSEEPDTVVLRSPEGGWVADHDGREEPVVHGSLIRVRGQSWRLCLPEHASLTLRDGLAAPTLEQVAFRFEASEDGDHVQLTLDLPTGPRHLPPRAHHGLILSLARRWIDDRRAGRGPLDSGWTSIDDLLRELPAAERATGWGRINLHVFKCRREMVEAGIEGATRVVERRRGAELLRFGGKRASILEGDRMCDAEG